MLTVKKVKEALRSATSSPFTVRYPYVPSPPPPTFRGKPEYDEDKCVGCGICVERCPSDAIEIEDLGNERKLTIHYEFCIYCANCNYRCMPLEGVKPSHSHGEVFKDKSEAIFTIQKPTVVAKVDEELCIGCARCQYACQFGAAKVIKKEDRWVSSIDPLECTGCGLCGSICPAIVIDIPLSPQKEVVKTIQESPDFPNTRKKNVLIFHCNWAQITPEELTNSFDTINLKFVNVTCSGRLHPVFVLEAFNRGYDGVMVFACPEEECHFEGGGPQSAKSLVGKLKSLLDEVGLEPARLELVLGSNEDPKRYHNALSNMMQRLGEMGNSKLRGLGS